MPVKAVLFDVDGTLIDSTGIILERHRLAAKQLHLPEKDFADYANLPQTWEETLAQMWPGIDVEKFKAVFRTCKQMESKAFPGAVEAVKALAQAGMPLGIVTNKLRANAISHLAAAGYDVSCFSFVHGQEPNAVGKPDKRAFDQAIRFLEGNGIRKEDAVYVGDAVIDQVASTNAGIPFIGVLTGFAKKKDFNGAAVLNSVSELPKALA